MSIAVVCPKCSAKLNAPDSAAGKRVKCPKCQTAMTVPEPLPEAAAFEVVDEPQPAKKPVAKPKAVVKADVELDEDDEKPRKKKQVAKDDDDEEDEDKPKKKKKKKAAAGEGVSMARNVVMGALLVVLTGVAGWVFYDRSKKKDEAEKADNSTNTPAVTPEPSGPGRTGPGRTGPVTPIEGDPGRPKPVGTPGQPQTLNSHAGYRITFPGPYVKQDLPKQIQDQIGLPVTVYISEDRPTRQEFVAASVDFPSNFTAADKKNVYDKVIKTLVEDAPNAASVSRRTVTVGGRSWEEITAKDGKSDRGGVMRVLRTDAHIYVLVAAGRDASASADVTKRYFDSFELTKETPPSGSGTADKTQTLTSPAGFKVTFPGPYQKDDFQTKDLKEHYGLTGAFHTWSDVPSGVTCFAAHVDFPPTATAADKKMHTEKVVKGITNEEFGFKVPSRRTVTVGTQTWQEITTKDPAGISTRVTRALQADTRLYILVVAKDKGEPPADVLKRFFDSFELTK
jgi:hypothetical protein